MSLRIVLAICGWLALAPQSLAQTAPPRSAPRSSPPRTSTPRTAAVQSTEWRTSGETNATAARKDAPTTTLRGLPKTRLVDDPGDGNASGTPLQAMVPRPKARVSSEMVGLPSEHGQRWQVYDISPYTSRVTTTNKPEQAVVDWILRETGYEVWHTEPLGLLSADANSLKVYHTPDMQSVVASVVDRFVNSETESHAFGLRVITVDNPNWRAQAQKMMRPINVQTQGVQAWLMAKEDAALLLAELRKRTDYREHSSPHLLVGNGQSTVVSATRPLNYIKDVLMRPNVWPGFETEAGQIDEGFSLELNPLLTIEGDVIDAVVKCNIDQVEELRPVMLEIPNPVQPRQRTKIEVPQVTHCRLHERFRWPIDQVLLVGLGVVATPVPADKTQSMLERAMLVPKTPPRADLLLFVESKGKSGQAPLTSARTGSAPSQAYRGRY